jgi:RNA polymerase sigma factor (TIGR02999 family)
MSELTRILEATAHSQPEADRLLPFVYNELRLLAARKMSQESGTQTLQPTALVHEAWLRLGGDEQPTWENRTHFFFAAAEAMRRILIDRARRKHALRHGGGQERCDLEKVEIAAPSQDNELLVVHELLDRFAAQEPQKAELVKLRYFAGLSLKAAGQVLGISEPTAVRWWIYSKTWLYQALQETEAPGRGATTDGSRGF